MYYRLYDVIQGELYSHPQYSIPSVVPSHDESDLSQRTSWTNGNQQE